MQIPKMSQGLTLQIFLATLFGVIFGLGCHAIVHDPGTIGRITGGLDLITTIFLRAIKMIIAPLVIGTLVSGIGRMGDSSAVGRVAAKSMLWFIVAALVALFIGLIAVETMAPGIGLHIKASAAQSGIKVPPFTLTGFLENMVPTSIVDAMSRNDVLPIVIFSIVAGLAITRLGEAGKELLRFAEALTSLMLQMATFIMRFAPVAVFTAISTALVERGAGIVVTYASYVGGFYLALACVWIAMVAAGTAVLGRRAQWELLKAMRQPALIALATTSS
jgi:Na+/H+-dicarboxylate symporter